MKTVHLSGPLYAALYCEGGLNQWVLGMYGTNLGAFYSPDAVALVQNAIYQSNLSLVKALEQIAHTNTAYDPYEPANIARKALAAHGTQNCPTCGGNDLEMPCAYPGEGKPGCLRDVRLQSGNPLVKKIINDMRKGK